MTEITREAVLAYLAANPGDTNKRDIARGMGVNGAARRELRLILKVLEDEGVIARVGKRSFASADAPPPTGIVVFTHIDDQGDLVGRAQGRDGAFGPEIIYSGPSGRRKDRDPGINDRALCHIEEGRDGLWRAKMIKRLETQARSIIGVYEATGHGGRIETASRKDRQTYIVFPGDENGAANGDLVRCEPKPSRGHGPKRAKITEIIGPSDNPRAASLLAMAAHNIRDTFPDAVIEEAETAKPVECPRTDLTDLPLLTIDPEDARDHDDAVFAAPDDDPKNPGGWRVIVAIADVSAFVPYKAPLDREAYERANSTYFPDRVASMLPEALSAGECSLHEGENRFCMAMDIRFSASGERKSFKVLRGVMRSVASLSYEEAQAAIDGEPSDRAKPLLDTVLRPLWEAWRAVDKKRAERGPLELDLPERRVWLSDDGEVEGVRIRDRFDAHRLIEEFMIQANVCAAEALEAKQTPLVYRVHAPPSDEKMHGLSDFLKSLDIKWTVGERVLPARFNRLLDHAKTIDRLHEISEIVLRSQSQAIYSPDNEGHFGLNLAKYAHFTSPIRRYADLIVHRALICAYGLGPDGLPQEQAVQLEDISNHLVECERASMAAERDANDRYLTRFLADRIGAEFEGRITGVAKFGLFVRLEETAADGFIPAASLSDEYWVWDEKASALIAEQSGMRFELGQPVRVKLNEADPISSSLLLEMLSDPRPKRKGEKPPRKQRHRRATESRYKHPGKSSRRRKR